MYLYLSERMKIALIGLYRYFSLLNALTLHLLLSASHNEIMFKCHKYSLCITIIQFVYFLPFMYLSIIG